MIGQMTCKLQSESSNPRYTKMCLGHRLQDSNSDRIVEATTIAHRKSTQVACST